MSDVHVTTMMRRLLERVSIWAIRTITRLTSSTSSNEAGGLSMLSKLCDGAMAPRVWNALKTKLRAPV